MTSIEPIMYEGRPIVPLQFLKAVLPDPASLGPRTKGKTNIGCIFTGKKDGKPLNYYLYNICDHQECYREVGSQVISYTTGVPAMIGASLLMNDTWKLKGVRNIEDFARSVHDAGINGDCRGRSPTRRSWSTEMAFTGYFDPGSKLLRTPCYVISLDRLRENGAILRDVSERSGAKILLAQKAFSTYPAYPALAEYLDGTTASGLYEAKLGYEYFRRADGSGSPETHVFSPYYRTDEFDELLSYVSHISFNSPSQLEKFAAKAIDRGVSPGLRLNPEFSTQSHGIYDPCGEFSRLGTTFERLEENRSAVERLARAFICTPCASSRRRI